MMRGPNKPADGARLPAGAFVNAGVMLLQPDADVLAEMLSDITGPEPTRLTNYNSPDADYLVQHSRYSGRGTRCRWNTITSSSSGNWTPSRARSFSPRHGRNTSPTR